jgi:CRP-like cAMP-binding protein
MTDGAKDDATVAILRRVDFLHALDDEILVEIASRARRVRYAKGDCVVSELEAGADVFIVLDGEAEVSVEPRAGARCVLGGCKPGGAFGEMSSLTGELRSATVTALTNLEVLVITDSEFDQLRERRPAVAVAMVRMLAKRLGEAERSLDALLGDEDEEAAPSKVVAAAAGAAGAPVQRGSLARVWRELVVNHRRDLAFITLAAFVATLIFVRIAVHVSFRFDWAPRDVLRAAYLTGFGLLVSSSCVSLLRFRAGWRRVVALAYGIGIALIFNELGVTLAFDIFYKDIHTADPNAPFDVERLYERTEALRAIVIGLVVLLQAVYLRTFYRRVLFIAKTRLRKVFAGART